MTRDLPFWIHQARKEPQMAVLQGRVFEIGTPDVINELTLLTVWQSGRPIGHVLRTEPVSYRASAAPRESASQTLHSIEDLLSLLVRTPAEASTSPKRAARS
jgi:hypothetical protein